MAGGRPAGTAFGAASGRGPARTVWRAAIVVAAAALAAALAAPVSHAADVSFENLAAPTGLTATHSQDGVVLDWTAPVVAPNHPEIDSYQVEWRRQGGLGWTKIAVKLTSTEHVSSVKLVGGRTYEYRVVALFATDEISAFSPYSDIVSFDTPSVAAPTSLTATRAADGIQLAWQAPTSTQDGPTLTGYEIRRSEFRPSVFGEENDIIIPEWIAVNNADAVDYLDGDAEVANSYGYAILAVYGYVQSVLATATPDVVAGGL